MDHRCQCGEFVAGTPRALTLHIQYSGSELCGAVREEEEGIGGGGEESLAAVEEEDADGAAVVDAVMADIATEEEDDDDEEEGAEEEKHRKNKPIARNQREILFPTPPLLLMPLP